MATPSCPAPVAIVIDSKSGTSLKKRVIDGQGAILYPDSPLSIMMVNW